MIENLIHLAGDIFAVDIDVLSTRHWWSNSTAITTFKNLEEITDKYWVANEVLIKLKCDKDPLQLQNLLELNQTMKSNLNWLVTIGKDMLYESYLDSTRYGHEWINREVLFNTYELIKSSLLDFDSKLKLTLDVNLDVHKTSQEKLEALEYLRKYKDNLSEEAIELLKSYFSNIVEELNNNVSSSSSSSLSRSHSPGLEELKSSSSTNLSRSPSPVLEELKKYPNRFR